MNKKLKHITTFLFICTFSTLSISVSAYIDVQINSNTSVSNTVSAYANSGGNSVSEGEVSEGDSKASVHIKTVINDEVVEEVYEEDSDSVFVDSQIEYQGLVKDETSHEAEGSVVEEETEVYKGSDSITTEVSEEDPVRADIPQSGTTSNGAGGTSGASVEGGEIGIETSFVEKIFVSVKNLIKHVLLFF